MDYTVPTLSTRHLIVGLIMTVGLQVGSASASDDRSNKLDATIKHLVEEAYRLGASVDTILKVCKTNPKCIRYAQGLTAGESESTRPVAQRLSIAL
jgi:hypothetical protein